MWEGKKAVLDRSSPVVHRGHVYQLTKAGVLHCLNARTGEEFHDERLNTTCWATPVAAGDHLYFFSRDGMTAVVEAGPKYSVVAVNRLWSDADHKARVAAAEKAPESQFPPLPK